MSKQRAGRPPLSGRQERRALQDEGLLDVLDSFPAPESFVFINTQKSGHDAIKLPLGPRQQGNGSECQAWSCIQADNKEIKPPVVFYDEGPGDHDVRYRQSATSLLRKATGLCAPFCFLQIDPHDAIYGTKDVRNMLCAIVLYLALVTGSNTCALQWAYFEGGMIQALRHIKSRASYQQWRHEQRVASSDASKVGKTMGQKAQPKPEEAMFETQSAQYTTEGSPTTSASCIDAYTGGLVRSSGSAVTIKPCTSLSVLKNQLGNKRFELLDNIPSVSIVVSRHSFDPPYFPFRVRIGTHDWASEGPLAIYAYLVHDGIKKNVMKILSHNKQGDERSWPLERLEDLTLFEPFKCLNKLKTKSDGAKPGPSARAAKIRSVVAYYFFLAENEGSIGDPRIQIGEAFCKRLSTACAELGKAGFHKTEDTTDKEGADDQNGIANSLHSKEQTYLAEEFEEEESGLAQMEESYNKPSCIVVLRLKPRVLSGIIRSVTTRFRNDISEETVESDRSRHNETEQVLEKAADLDSPLHQPATINDVAEGGQLQVEGLQAAERSTLATTVNTEPPAGVDPCPNLSVMSDQAQSRQMVVAMTPNRLRMRPDSTSSPSQNNSAATPSAGFPTESNEYTSVFERQATAKSGFSQFGSDDEFLPVASSSSSSSTTSNRSQTPAVQMIETRASSVHSNTLIHHISVQKPSTPDNEPEPRARVEPAVLVPSEALIEQPNVVELSSDGEVEDAPLPRSQNEVEATPDASERNYVSIDLTQTSPSPRGKKRMSVLVLDSDDDLIEEVDITSWRRASRNR